MKISFVTPHAELQLYIKSFWVLESPNGLPATAHSIAAPNGCAKLIVPYDNSIVSVADGRVQTSWAHRMYFVGNRDGATLLRSSARQTGFIAVEFRPHGAFPILGVPMSETANRLRENRLGVRIVEPRGPGSRQQPERVDERVAYIGLRLVLLVRNYRREPGIVDHCLSALRSVDGRMSIGELARHTGYSRRYLDRVFQQHVGLSPKILAEIFRFQRFYRKWAAGASFDLLKAELYDHYYDQAHFTREFKRMTGHPPQKFMRDVPNEFGRRLARQQIASA